jgi:histidine triad (HIT) family protein
MSTLFSKIIKGEIPAYKIAEDDHFLAFLDAFPIAKGHVLVVPKEGTDKFYHVSDPLLQEWLLFAKPIAQAIEQVFPCTRCGMAFVGLEIPHAHMHLVPVSHVQDMNFTNPKLKLSAEEFKIIQNQLKTALVQEKQ